MYKPIKMARMRWPQVLALLLLFVANLSIAQQGTQGNTTVFNNAEMTFFGAHTFVTGGSGTQAGIIKTMRTAPVGVLSYGSAATQNAATDANHIDGYVGKYGTAAFTFPIGNGTKLRTAGISAPAASGLFKAAYWFSNPNVATLPAGAPFLVASLGTGVTGVSNLEYWDIDGPSAVNITLSWDVASALGTLTASNIANLIVVGYNPTTSKWESLGNAGGTTGTLATTGTITANGVTPDTYSAFTFGSAAAVPDLRPLVSMADRNFVKPTGMSKAFTIRIGNLISGTTTTGIFSVFLSVGSSFTAALNGATGWTLTDDGGGEYSLSSSVTVAGGAVVNVPMSLTANGTIAKGNYSMSVTIDDNAGGETNNLNNNVTADVSVSL